MIPGQGTTGNKLQLRAHMPQVKDERPHVSQLRPSAPNTEMGKNEDKVNCIKTNTQTTARDKSDQGGKRRLC